MKQITQIFLFWIRLKFLQNLDASRIACFPQCSREALRVVLIRLVRLRTERARARSGPQHKTYPLYVALATEVSESTIRLLLQRGGLFRTRALQLNKRTQCGSDLVAECNREWRTLHSIGASLQKEAKDVRVPL